MLFCTERSLMWQAIDKEPPACVKDDVDIELVVILGAD